MKIIVDKNGYYLRDYILLDTATETEIDAAAVDGIFKPRWNGETWEESATQEYIDSLKAQAEPIEPTESERLEALEMLMLDVLGGGF